MAVQGDGDVGGGQPDPPVHEDVELAGGFVRGEGDGGVSGGRAPHKPGQDQEEEAAAQPGGGHSC